MLYVCVTFSVISTGHLTHFTILLNVILWFLHVLHLYLNVLFPLKFLILKEKKWKKRIHITEVIASIVFASLGPAAIWLSNTNYNTFIRPPLLCFPASKPMLIYTICFPILIVLILGVNLIAAIMWALLKVICVTRFAKRVLYAHHFKPHLLLPFNSHINPLTIHVCTNAKGCSVCFCWGWFTSRVTRPQVPRLSAMDSPGR